MSEYHFCVILAVCLYAPVAGPKWRTFLFWLFVCGAVFSALTSGVGA